MIESILVCDDDQEFRIQLARSLRKRNIKTFEASNTEEALEVADNYTIEAAIVDLKFGKENGLDLVSTLKQKLPQLKVVMLTGFGSITTAIQAIKQGADNYLTKPCSIEQILQTLSQNAATPIQTTSIQPLAEVEREYIQRALEEHEGNISKTAKTLGLHRRSLQRKLNSGQIS